MAMAGARRICSIAAVVGLFLAMDGRAQALQGPTDRLLPCLALAKSGGTEEMDVGTCIIENETVGPLRVGLDAAAAIGAVACPLTKGEDAFEEATGSYVQSWMFPDCGVTLIMESDEPGGAKRVGGITIVAPSQLRTSREIGIGTPEATALAASEPFLDREMTVPGEVIVAGSPYGGLLLNLENGVVSEIFLGASAE